MRHRTRETRVFDLITEVVDRESDTEPAHMRPRSNDRAWETMIKLLETTLVKSLGFILHSTHNGWKLNSTRKCNFLNFKRRASCGSVKRSLHFFISLKKTLHELLTTYPKATVRDLCVE
jgi:hypothetical protein